MKRWFKRTFYSFWGQDPQKRAAGIRLHHREDDAWYIDIEWWWGMTFITLWRHRTGEDNGLS